MAKEEPVLEPEITSYDRDEIDLEVIFTMPSTMPSDRNAKERFVPVEPGEMLSKVVAPDIRTFKAEELDVEIIFTGGTTMSDSDRSLKENFKRVQPVRVLDKAIREPDVASFRAEELDVEVVFTTNGTMIRSDRSSKENFCGVDRDRVLLRATTARRLAPPCVTTYDAEELRLELGFAVSDSIEG